MIIAIHMPQIPPRLNHVPHPPLQLLDLGKPPVHLAVPQHRLRLVGGCGGGARSGSSSSSGSSTLWRRGGGGGGGDLDDKDAACGGLQGDLAEGDGEGGEELLGVLGWG